MRLSGHHTALIGVGAAVDYLEDGKYLPARRWRSRTIKPVDVQTIRDGGAPSRSFAGF
jgi:hypothetical protein